MLAAAGLPRMPARVMMALVGSPGCRATRPPSSADRLGVSPAAVSGAVRYLQSLRMIQRLSRPGDRVARYDLIDDGWRSMVTANAPLYARLAESMEAIADENADAPLSVARARATADFLRFLAERMPQLVVEWEASPRVSGRAIGPSRTRAGLA